MEKKSRRAVFHAKGLFSREPRAEFLSHKAVRFHAIIIRKGKPNENENPLYPLIMLALSAFTDMTAWDESRRWNKPGFRLHIYLGTYNDAVKESKIQ